MQGQENAVRSQTKKRLQEMLKTALGGAVVAAATLTTPAVQATTVTGNATPALEERVKELRQQLPPSTLANAVGNAANAWHNWGNHWHNWNNWHNWGNWHNW